MAHIRKIKNSKKKKGWGSLPGIIKCPLELQEIACIIKTAGKPGFTFLPER